MSCKTALTALREAIDAKLPEDKRCKKTIPQMTAAVQEIEVGGGGIDFYKCASIAAGGASWSGYKATQGSDGSWSFASSVTNDLTVAGYYPVVGRVYSADTTVWAESLYKHVEGKMVLLCHFEENQQAFMDSTDTCFCKIMPQANPENRRARFGDFSCYRNYIMLGGNGGMSVYGLPEMDAFTFEMWQHPGANSPKAGGYILYMPAENGDIERTLNGVEWGNYQANTNHHCVWQRRAGTGIVEEYVNGVKVGEIEFSAPIGGRRVDVYGRGTSGDSVTWMDEVTFFDYAKYNGDFTPPTEPYKDIVSGLNQNTNAPREVTVSGLACRFANDPSYALKDSSQTGINRVWATADNKYFVRYSWDYYSWVIADKEVDSWESPATTYATLTDPNGLMPEETEPIGNSGWKDNFTQQSVSVVYN